MNNYTRDVMLEEEIPFVWEALIIIHIGKSIRHSGSEGRSRASDLLHLSVH